MVIQYFRFKALINNLQTSVIIGVIIHIKINKIMDDYILFSMIHKIDKIRNIFRRVR